MSRRDRDRDRDRERDRDRDRDRERDRDRDGDRDRYGRESDSRRRRSGFDREPSPKRSRRDEKPETERVPRNTNLGGKENTDGDQNQWRWLQNALPLEAPSAADSKVDSAAGSKEADKKVDGNLEGSKNSSDPTQMPRPRSYFQHDERGNARQAGRSFGRRGATERHWRDSKDDRDERATNKSTIHDSQKRDEKSQAKVDIEAVWRHDGFHKMEAEPPPAVRKRPAFREKKIPVEAANNEKAAADPLRPSRFDHPAPVTERREERDHSARHSDRHERSAAGDWGEAHRGGSLSRERYGGRGNHRGRDRLSGREGYRPSVSRGEKWKHDLFDEANKNITRANEEDQIAKVEALLAS